MSRTDSRDALVEFAFHSRLAGLDGDAILRLVRQAWRSNIESGLTGEIRLRGRSVRQVVEGSASIVLPLAARILADVRHEAVEVTAFGALPARRFAGWHVHGLPAGPRFAAGPAPDGVVALYATALRPSAAPVARTA